MIIIYNQIIQYMIMINNDNDNDNDSDNYNGVDIE